MEEVNASLTQKNAQRELLHTIILMLKNLAILIYIQGKTNNQKVLKQTIAKRENRKRLLT